MVSLTKLACGNIELPSKTQSLAFGPLSSVSEHTNIFPRAAFLTAEGVCHILMFGRICAQLGFHLRHFGLEFLRSIDTRVVAKLVLCVRFVEPCFSSICPSLEPGHSLLPFLVAFLQALGSLAGQVSRMSLLKLFTSSLPFVVGLAHAPPIPILLVCRNLSLALLLLLQHPFGLRPLPLLRLFAIVPHSRRPALSVSASSREIDSNVPVLHTRHLIPTLNTQLRYSSHKGRMFGKTQSRRAALLGDLPQRRTNWKFACFLGHSSRRNR